MLFIRNAGLDEAATLKFFLMQNSPNPFQKNTTIRYCVASKTKVIIIVINSDGVVVEKLISKEQEAGIYEIEFNAENLPSGIYIYRISAGNYMQTKKMILLRQSATAARRTGFVEVKYMVSIIELFKA